MFRPSAKQIDVLHIKLGKPGMIHRYACIYMYLACVKCYSLCKNIEVLFHARVQDWITSRG